MAFCVELTDAIDNVFESGDGGKEAGEHHGDIDEIDFCNDEKLLPDSYRRYLESKIRDVTPYTGLPLLMHMRERETKAARHTQTQGQPKRTPGEKKEKKVVNKKPAPRRKALPARGMSGRRQGG